jgi:hypothetical protein
MSAAQSVNSKQEGVKALKREEELTKDQEEAKRHQSSLLTSIASELYSFLVLHLLLLLGVVVHKEVLVNFPPLSLAK